MVRNFKCKRSKIDKEKLAQAIEAVKNGQSVYAASKTFEIACATLRSHAKSSKPAKHKMRVSPRKLSAALASVEGGKAIKEAAKEVGIAFGTLQKYRMQNKNDGIDSRQGRKVHSAAFLSIIVHLCFISFT